MTATAPARPSSAPYHYREDGFTIVRNGLHGPLMAEVAERLAALIARLRPDERPEGLVEPPIYAPDWRFWLELCRHPRIVQEVTAAMGADELTMVMSHLIVKPPFDGKAVAWHQDNTYWPWIDGTELCTVWLAIDEVDVGNACMHVIPRTHAERLRMEKLATDGADLLKVRVEVTPEQEASAIPVELSPGQFSIHDSFIIHGSEANTSPRRRAGYTMRYADAARVKIDLEKHWAPVYYLHGDGTSLVPGMFDLRPGRALPAVPDFRKDGRAP